MNRTDSSAGVRDGLPATLVRSRVGPSRKKLHRQDADTDEPQPACRHADADREYGHVDPVVYPDARQRLCRAPACFGDRDRQGGEP